MVYQEVITDKKEKGYGDEARNCRVSKGGFTFE